ncbi:glycophorin-C isoform X1 [Genypterus blacodes]|uniref:glycophorin-C isoform X1 n=1 Tax=Genypterus blacodes TaxID=154954 RepID=UPI003F75D3FF
MTERNWVKDLTTPTLAVTDFTTVAEVVTHTAKPGIYNDETFAAIVGGTIVAVLLILICVVLMLTWLISRHKGSYVTNEADDEESLASDEALQSKEPLRTEEDE